MPELPEVETTCRGVAPHCTGERVTNVIVRDGRLRWPVDPALATLLSGHCINGVTRRGKYLIFDFDHGGLLLHLGMSGNLRVVQADLAAERHDHIDIVLGNGLALRLNDPRRFGCVLWSEQPSEHPLLIKLGPEPLSNAFTARDLHKRSRKRKLAIKSFVMDSHVVVGVGNIYANEALFRAGIRPTVAAGRISLKRYELLVDMIREVLEEAIEQGGTTLRDFVSAEGKPGYFAQELHVYGKKGEPCISCGTPIKMIVQAQRATYFCSECQKL